MPGRTKVLDIIQFFPPKASCFLVIPLVDWGRDGAQERSMKQEVGTEHNIWKNDIAPGHNVNRLKTHPEVAEQP